MEVCDVSSGLIESQGSAKRRIMLEREKRYLSIKMRDSLSFYRITVDGENREAAIINSDNLNEKEMLSLPGEDFKCGGLVEWADNRWLITEKDANNEVYTRVKLVQCNYLLRWVDSDNIIHEQWCIVEDGTKLGCETTQNSLAYRKRYVKRVPLIAGIPLEPYRLQRSSEIYANVTVRKLYGLGDQQPSSE